MRFLTCEGGIRKEEVVAKGEGEVLKGDVGIRMDEVVAEGEKEVVKDEVLQTSNLEYCAKHTTS